MVCTLTSFSFADIQSRLREGLNRRNLMTQMLCRAPVTVHCHLIVVYKRMLGVRRTLLKVHKRILKVYRLMET